ncbi:MAG: 2-keto-4-pentenoate hydratase [Paracoccaceae bacterium]
MTQDARHATADPSNAAQGLLDALAGRRPFAPLSTHDPAFDLAAGYRVAAEVRRLRQARGERPVGRKIGFTNTTIWAEYAVAAPIWGTLYDTTLHALADLDGPFALAPFVEPRLEPEIAFGLRAAPEPGMDERALLGCVGWVAHGFEIVQSLFPAWRFTAPDTVAAFGLHGALLLGPRVAVTDENVERWYADLATFRVTLSRDGVAVEEGEAANVLGGGPLAALRHLVDTLAADPSSPPLAPGEVVTTGTLTRALPVSAGERWSTHLAGLPLAGIGLALGGRERTSRDLGSGAP